MREDEEGRERVRWGKRGERMENLVKVSSVERISEFRQSKLCHLRPYSATAGPFRVMVLVSTTNTTAFASRIWSLNWPRSRGCPGTSRMRSCRFTIGGE